MSPQMQQYTPGRPQTYVAAKTFALGKTGVTLQRGMEFDFDGALLTIPGYAPIQMPELRGAIRQGWIVPAAQFDVNDYSATRPVAANVQVRRADGGNPMNRPASQAINTAHVESEEREVQNVRSHATGVRTANTNFRRGAENRAIHGRFVTRIEEQDAVEVPGRGFRTPAKQETNLERVSIHQAITEANSVRIQPGQGQTREEMLEQMDPESAAQYAAEIESRRAALAPETIGAPIVGQVRTARTVHREGFTVNNHVGGGVETADLAGLDTAAKDQVAVIESEGIRFTTTNGPKHGVVRQAVQQQKPAAPTQTKLVRTAAPAKPVDIKGTEDTRRKIAKAMCSDFPDLYNFDDPERKKVARIQADFDDRPDVIRAIFAAEGDAMKARLLQEFPEAFA